MSEAANASSHDEHPIAHVMPLPVLLGVFAALMVLTFLTVAATWVDLGWFNLPIAMAIATVKATLVALYFMHLRYDAPFNGLALLVALVFVALFILITLLDTFQYQPDVELYRDKTGVSAPGSVE
jgi:cytochrome c oxidase subunit 4